MLHYYYLKVICKMLKFYTLGINKIIPSDDKGGASFLFTISAIFEYL